MKYRFIMEFETEEDLNTLTDFLWFKIEGKHLFQGKTISYREVIEEIKAKKVNN